jgi:hypothetical protein
MNATLLETLATLLTGCIVSLVAAAFNLYARLVRLEERVASMQKDVSHIRNGMIYRTPHTVPGRSRISSHDDEGGEQW